MQHYIVGAVGGAILSAVVMTAMGAKSGPRVERDPVECGGDVDTLILEREVESLRRQVQDERQKCNLAGSIEKGVQDRNAMLAREADRQKREAQAAEAQRASFMKRARSGQLTVEEWEVVVGKSKAEVIELLGKPAGVQKPLASGEFGLEIWSYHNFVKLEESPKRRILLIHFQKDQAIKVSSTENH